MNFPKVTDKGDRYTISDPARGIGLSIEKKATNGCWMVGLALVIAPARPPLQLSAMHVFELGTN